MLWVSCYWQPPRFYLRLGVRMDKPISSSGHRARRWAGGMPVALGPGRVTHPTQGPLCACAGPLPELTCAAAGAQQRHQPLWALQQAAQWLSPDRPELQMGKQRLFHVLTVRLISGLKPWCPGGIVGVAPRDVLRLPEGPAVFVSCALSVFSCHAWCTVRCLRSGLFPGRGCSCTGQRTWAGACGPSRTSPRAPSSASK